MNSVMTVSGGQQSGLAIHIQVFVLFQTPLPSRLPDNTEQSSLRSKSRYLLVIRFNLHRSVYMSIPSSPTILPSWEP